MNTKYSFQKKDQINKDIFDINVRELTDYRPFYVTVSKVKHVEYELVCPVVSYNGTIYKECSFAKMCNNTSMHIKEHGRSLWLLGEHLLNPLDILYIKDWTRSLVRSKGKRRYVLIVHEYEKVAKWKTADHYEKFCAL